MHGSGRVGGCRARITGPSSGDRGGQESARARGQPVGGLAAVSRAWGAQGRRRTAYGAMLGCPSARCLFVHSLVVVQMSNVSHQTRAHRAVRQLVSSLARSLAAAAARFSTPPAADGAAGRAATSLESSTGRHPLPLAAWRLAARGTGACEAPAGVRRAVRRPQLDAG